MGQAETTKPAKPEQSSPPREDVSTEATQPECQNNLMMLFNILEEKEVNPVLAGYVSKILCSLMSRRKKELVEYIFNHTGIWYGLIEHCYSPSIVDVIDKLIQIDPFANDRDEAIQAYKEETIRMLFSKISSKSSDEICAGACKIILNSMQCDYVLNYFSKISNWEATLKGINECSSASLNSLIDIIIALIESENGKFVKNIQNIDMIQQIILSILPKTKDILASNLSAVPTLLNQQNLKFVPFSSSVLKIVKLYYFSIKLNSIIVTTELNKLKIINLLIDLVGCHYNNTNFHIGVFNILTYCLKISAQLCDDIIISNHVPSELLSLSDNRVGNFVSGRAFIKPYDIFLLKFAAEIEQEKTSNLQLKAHLSSIAITRHPSMGRICKQ